MRDPRRRTKSRPRAQASTRRANRRSIIHQALLAALLLAPASVTQAREATTETPAAPVDVATGELARSIDALLKRATFLKGAEIGISVIDVGSGAVLYQRTPDLPLNPASGIKVVTTASALALLGPEARFATRLYTDKGARADRRVIKGDLYLVGGGDPLLVTENLYKLADDLYTRGLRRISGGIVVDSSAFDHDGLPPGFDQKTEFAAYRAPGGATSVNFNSFVTKVFPGAREGEPARVEIVPPIPSIQVTNRVTTAAGRRDHVTVSPTPGADGVLKLELGGTIGVELDAASYRYPVSDPSRYAGELLRLLLEQRGIKVTRKNIRFSKKPRDAARLAIHRSRSLAVLIRSVNKLSNNFMAEQVLKLIDTAADAHQKARRAPATTTGALARVRAHLESMKIPLEGFHMSNGSGLYDTNRITAAQMTALLSAVYRDFRYAAEFVSSLPLAGADGTLRRRLKKTPQARMVRAKTGTLNGVSSLSGYAGAHGARPLAFSILVNGFEKWKIGKVRRLQNEIAIAVVARANQAS